MSHRSWPWWISAWLLAASVIAAPRPGTPAVVAPVYLLRIDGVIGPASADQLRRGLAQAQSGGAQLFVLQLNTPGGLDGAMRSIIQAILASPIPVASYVAPQGARAASAGTYLLYASHIAAMAPATNLGAATPVALGGTGAAASPAASAASGAVDAHGDALGMKRVNDASAYIRSLAQLRGRNVSWAERAVREAVSLAANEALAQQVIDLIAEDLDDLLRRLDGRVLRPAGVAPITLATAGAAVVVLEPDWRTRLLTVIGDPSLALMLMLIGVYGLIFEFMNPGFVAPGVIGGVCLLLALWALQILPINYAGMALILLGLAFFVAEAFVPSYGVLGLGGIAAFVLGVLLLFDGDLRGFGVPPALVGALGLAAAAGVIGLASMAARARARPLRSGTQALLGAPARILEFDAGQGWAEIAGERWRVSAAQPLQAGQAVRVVAVHGLALEVHPIDIPPIGGAS